ncbi:response regulator [Mycetocola reblochoni]|uniref:DNA-binding response regulator, LuxR family n=2 Tax=Mycetocola reblochoni TaxID=331618 RepID=A0A1R4J0R0_9MICO|nr:response regulator transcription factor [Mycetocola reblochoni]RLP71206.1 DNA-binding response regulator [Mycetocola reblochoni]SJN25741.1 DNA-binding response regulator, LuxR family [Mycetocola reblochoni REB411]
MTRVMIVDDQEMIRAGLRVILEAHARIEVVADAADGRAALRTLEGTAVDVVLMDLNMPGMDGVETTRRIRSAHGEGTPRVLVLTTFDQDENVLAALRAGADGFLGKGAGPAELTEGVLAVAEGGHALSPNAVGALVGTVAQTPVSSPDPETERLFEQLTRRELEIVRLIVRGMDNAEIGREVFISPYTAKTHANRAMMKVGARDRAHLVSLAVQAGLLP